MSVNFPPFRFPNLRKLSFQFSVKFCQPFYEELSNFDDNKFSLWLLQSIINASGDLQELIFPFEVIDVVQATLEFLHLPSTIVFLQMELKLESKSLETLFLYNQLPNLKHLALEIHGKPVEDGLMYKILERVRKTLVSFHVGGVNSTGGRPNPHSFLQFPVMEKLECIYILSKECELDANQLTPLQEYLPKLNNVILEHQSEAMLRKWVEKSKFEGVNELIMSIVNEQLSGKEDNYFISPSRKIMALLSVTFPNIKELTLQVNIGSLDFLDCLFGKMRQVEKLQLEFHGRFQRNSFDLVDSLLTGLPLSLVGALKENKVDVLESVLVVPNGSQSTIRNLTGKYLIH